jgi:hypothetical protein
VRTDHLDDAIRKARLASSMLMGAQHRLSAVVVQECSIVDSGAVGRTFIIAKREYGSVIAKAQATRDRLLQQLQQLQRPHRARVLKASAEERGEQRYVLGIVLQPDVVDLQGDVVSADEIRKAAWDWLRHFRNVGLQHKGLINGKVHVVESYIAPTDMQIGRERVLAGSWLLGVHVADDGLWADVKSGKLTAFSMGGFAKKEPLS